VEVLRFSFGTLFQTDYLGLTVSPPLLEDKMRKNFKKEVVFFCIHFNFWDYASHWD
jgi:hypothetical protein